MLTTGYRWCFGIGALLVAASPSEAQTVMKLLSNGSPMIQVSAGGSFTMVVEVTDWTGSLRGYQFAVDAESLSGGCSGSLSADSSLSLIDQTDTAYPFVSLAAADRVALEDEQAAGYRYMALAKADSNSITATSSTDYYLGEIRFDVSSDAQGVFEIRLDEKRSFLRSGGPLAEISVDSYEPLMVEVGVPCCVQNTVAECCDIDRNGITDDVCNWCECEGFDGVCDIVAKAVPADMGGAFGACALDGFCNIHDRNHALTCFSLSNTCEALNIDAGGPFGNCNPDGFCNIHDANHALNCFSGTYSCSCPSGPSPELPPQIVEDNVIRLVANQTTVRPGQVFKVRAFLENGVHDIQSFQLEVGPSGGSGGYIGFHGAEFETRDDFLFTGFETDDTFSAVNMDRAQVLFGLNEGNAQLLPEDRYLGTFEFEASQDSEGTFVIDVLRDEAMEQHSYLVASFVDIIDITNTIPAVVLVNPSIPSERR